MSFHRSKVDMLWAESGDYSLDSVRGDLADTTSLPYRAFIQQVTTRIQSSKKDWKLQGVPAADLTRFIGKPNTLALGESIRQAVVNSLVQGSFIRSNELQVEVFPIAKNEIAILALIQPSGDRAQIRLAFTYNSQDNKIIPRNL